MKIVGRVESLWRYPVKSMRGEELNQVFVGFAGVYGDRVYAFHSSTAPKGFPYFTGREQQEMLLYRPRFRHPDAMMMPPNFAEADALGSGLTAIYGAPDNFAIDVETPSGETMTIDDPALIRKLRENLGDAHELTLLRSHRAMTDCRPISIFSIHTAGELSREVGTALDKRRFRANVYAELVSGKPFEEDEFVGRSLRIGGKVTISVVDRDARCKMITLDPDTGQANPEVMRQLARNHDTKAGIYAVVIVEGLIQPGDEITLVG